VVSPLVECSRIVRSAWRNFAAIVGWVAVSQMLSAVAAKAWRVAERVHQSSK